MILEKWNFPLKQSWKPQCRWVRTGRMEGVANPSNWLGYSHRDYDRDIVVFYLIPFNWIFRISRSVWNWIRYYWQYKDGGHTLERKAYQAGLKKGMELKKYETKTP